LLAGLSSLAQIKPSDSIIFVPLISPTIAINIPGGDLIKRFGTHGSLGGNASIKTRKNWVFGVQYDFIFGKDVKEQSILDNLRTSDGFIIDEEGRPAGIDLFERGHTVFLRGGKVLPHILGKDKTFGPNENSGLFIMGGVGFLLHRIHFTGTTPQLAGDYQKGYDRLSYGLGLSQFVGYMHLSDNRMLNFFVGMEFTEAWTVNKRGYNFDQMAVDNERRLDVISGIKVGWVLALYKKVANEFYYD